MPIHRGDTNAAMVAQIDLERETLQAVADEAARSLSFVSMYGNSAFITTAVNYPNGTSVVVRIDEDGKDFYVSDDGQGALCAELFGGDRRFNMIAPQIAEHFYTQYEQRTFFQLKVKRNQLPAAVSYIANASSMAVDRTLLSLGKHKARKSRDLFTSRVTEAFGENAKFDIPIQGRTKEWKFDAAVISNGEISIVFAFVMPSHSSIAASYMKLWDIRATTRRPKTAIVLSNYNATEASMRQILSTAADRVIPATSDIKSYQIAI